MPELKLVLKPMHESVDRVDLLCSVCKRWFFLSQQQYENRLAKGNKHPPVCSNQCQAKRRGLLMKIDALEARLARVGRECK